MKKLMLVLALLVVSLSLVMAEGQSDTAGKVYTFKYANTQSPNHPRSQSMELFKEQLEKASNGRIKV
jgi:TRAP-type C4-dicarboxylate transport system substrate-binding protein